MLANLSPKADLAQSTEMLDQQSEKLGSVTSLLFLVNLVLPSDDIDIPVISMFIRRFPTQMMGYEAQYRRRKDRPFCYVLFCPSEDLSLF